MKASEIKKQFLKGKVPFPVGKTVIVPVYKRVSKTHDKNNPSYKLAWTVGTAKVTGFRFEKDKRKFFFSIFFTHNAIAYKWIGQINHNRIEPHETLGGLSTYLWSLRTNTTNDNFFTKTWCEKVCEKLNEKEEVVEKSLAKINNHGRLIGPCKIAGSLGRKECQSCKRKAK